MRNIPKAGVLVLARLFATFFLLIFTFTVGHASAQEVTATINGVVTDPSGAAVPGAKVTAKDLDKGIPWTATTNGDGLYSLPRLPIGRYEVRVEQQGFQTALNPEVTLQLNQVAKVDITLQVGNISQTVQVESAAPVLQTESTSLGTVIDARTNTQLPLATRNYVQLTLLAPGAVHPDPSGFENGQATGNGGRPYINGNREQTNNFLLDGVDNNQASDNLVGYTPSPDAIQEFNLLENNASAEFGNFMGGIISASIKSGGNAFHGNVFEFFRNDKLNANDWQNNLVGTPRKLLRWNEFGATLGGPVVKNKLFFFVDYQGERFDTPGNSQGFTVLTAAERAGNFSQLLTLSTPIQLYDPLSPTHAPFPNNQIPVTRLSAVAQKIVNSTYYPLPINGNLANNQINTVSTHTNEDQGDARVDWAPSEKDHLFGRYSQSVLDNPTTNSQPLQYNSAQNYPVHNGVLNWTHSFGSSFVNDARVGVNYILITNGAASNGLPDLNASFGISGVPINILAAQSFSTTSTNTIGTNTIGTADNYELFGDTTIQYEDTAIWTKGSHSMHFGFQGWRQRIDTFYAGNNGLAGTFTYTGRFTALNGSSPGAAEADFLLGLPSQIGTGTSGGTWGQRDNILAGFFQDDWRLSRQLTINLGLRYEIHTPWVEVHNRETNFGLFSGAVQFPGQNGNSDALYNTYNGIGNWQPRIGLAFAPGNGKTVFRAAATASSYLEGTGTNLRLTINPPYSSEHNADYTALAYPTTTLDQGYAPINGTGTCTQAQALASSPNCYSGVNLRVWDPNFRPAQSLQWNASVQHEFGNSMTVQASYVGQKNTHLVVPQAYNQNVLVSPGVVARSPYLSGNPLLQSEIGQISGTAASGNQSYNGLQLVFQKRLSNGLAFQANYTWSKCMSDAIGYYGAGGQSGSQSAYFQNEYNAKSEWGPCFYDVEHVFSGYVTYDLPFGHNRVYGKKVNKVVNAVLGDWQVNAIPSFHTGFPLTVSANDQSGTNSRGARASCIASPVVFGEQDAPAALGGGYQWFSPTTFTTPASGTFGNCGVGTVRGPGLHTIDLSVSKLFPTFEHQNLEIRAEFINVSNTPILNAPNHSVGSELGVITGSQGARNIQFGVKYNF